MEPPSFVDKNDKYLPNTGQLEVTPYANDYFAPEYFEGVLAAIEKSTDALNDSKLELLELLANLHQTISSSYKKFSYVMYQLNSAGPDIKDIMIKARLVTQEFPGIYVLLLWKIPENSRT